MIQSQYHRKKLPLTNYIIRCIVSCAMVLLTQFVLSLVPCFMFSSSLWTQLLLSAMVLLLVMGLGGWFRRFLGVRGSAPAFVFFSIIFVWCFYFAVIRQAVSSTMDFVFNGEVALLILGLCSMLKSDPGRVIRESSSSDNRVEHLGLEINANDEDLKFSMTGSISESDEFISGGILYDSKDSAMVGRVRFCRICKAYIRGFDHHCPAFGNCIGQKNHLLFMVLLFGFLCTECAYLMCSSQIAAKSGIFTKIGFETHLSRNLVASTVVFTTLQLVWQVFYLGWHVYCVCFNIRTDEWINWKKYPEFQSVTPSQTGQRSSEMGFINPYDKGIVQNMKEFLSL